MSSYEQKLKPRKMKTVNKAEEKTKERSAKRIKELEKENKALLQKIKKLEVNNKVQSLLNEVLRHDILNPLAAIKMYLEIMEEDKSKVDPKIHARILRSTIRIEDIIESAREYARVDNISKIEKERRNIVPVIHKTIEEITPKFKESNLRIINRLPKSIIIPFHEKINWIFASFLSNCLKYAKNGKKVVIEHRKDDKNVYFRFIDFGEGVQDEFKKTIFERLSQEEKAGVQGAGIDLVIAKKIAKLHKGSVWVEDNPQGGAIFVLSLPKN